MSQKNYHTDNKSFIIYKEWEECVDELSDEDAGKLFKALFDFAARGEECKLKGCAKFTCMFMKSALERDGKKWEKVCKARSDAAKAKHAKEENSAKAAKATDKDKEKEKEKEKDKDNVYVYDKEKEKERRAPHNSSAKTFDIDEFEKFMRDYKPKLSSQKQDDEK